jgi:hypothetical protein
MLAAFVRELEPGSEEEESELLLLSPEPALVPPGDWAPPVAAPGAFP